MILWLTLMLLFFLFFISFHVIRKGLSVAFGLSVTIGIFLLFFSFFVMKDAVDFKENFGEAKQIFVFADQGKYYGAFEIDLENQGIEEFEEIASLTEMIRSEEIPEDYYKVFMIGKDAFEVIETVEVEEGKRISVNLYVDALYSEDPVEELGELMNYDVSSLTLEEKEEYRTQAFGLAIIALIVEDPMNMIRGLRKGNIIIYPETLMFKTIKLIPSSVSEKVTSIIKKEE